MRCNVGVRQSETHLALRLWVLCYTKLKKGGVMIINPLLIKKGDKRVLLNGKPPRVDCRIIAEDTFQEMFLVYLEKRTIEIQDLRKELNIKTNDVFFNFV